LTGDGTGVTPLFNLVSQNFGSHFTSATSEYRPEFYGLYCLSMNLVLSGIGSSHSGLHAGWFVDSTYHPVLTVNPYALSVSGNLAIATSTVLFLSNGRIIKPWFRVDGGGKTVGLYGDTSNNHSRLAAAKMMPELYIDLPFS
jgi:hypothetical protein